MPGPKGTAAANANGKRGSSNAIPVHCVEDGCAATTALELVGTPPFEGGNFTSPGWSALADPESGTLIFVCPTCYEAKWSDEAPAEPAGKKGARSSGIA